MQASILYFIKIPLERLMLQASWSPAVDQAITAVQQKVQDLTSVYSKAEMGSYLDLSIDSIRDGQGKDVLDLMQVRVRWLLCVERVLNCYLHSNACPSLSANASPCLESPPTVHRLPVVQEVKVLKVALEASAPRTSASSGSAQSQW